MNEKAKNLETILVISTGFLVLHFFLGHQWLLWVALIVSLLGLLSPTLANWINWVWFKIAHVLGWVNTRILLTLVFFIFLVPVAFLANLFSKDKLQLKRKKDKKASYYIERNHQFTKKDLENVW